MENRRSKQTVQLGLLIATEIILSRFFSIATPLVKIGFSFVPIALAAMLYGPLCAGMVGALGDFLGAMLFPIGPFFPGFTLTAFLTGCVYGAFFYKQPRSKWKILCAVSLVSLLLHLGLDTLWLWMMTGNGVLALLPERLLKCILMIPIQTATLSVLFHSVKRVFRFA